MFDNFPSRTEIPDEQLRGILAKIPLFQAKETPAPAAQSSLSEPEKKLRALRKKLPQIKRLKEMQSNGEKMEETQVKIKHI